MNITLNIQTTTGGNFSVLVENTNTVENLKKIVAKKLKVAKDRICLLHRERELQDGTLKDNGLVDGSKIILTPNVETGLLAQRAENTVMQALESLNDAQVNDFLSGKSPLNLSVRLGDHMMLIQLQLSTLNPGSSSSSTASNSALASSSSSTSQSTIISTTSTSLASTNPSTSRSHHRSSASKSRHTSAPYTITPGFSSSSHKIANSSSSSATSTSTTSAPAAAAIASTSTSTAYTKFKRHNSDDLNYNYSRLGTNLPQHFHHQHPHHSYNNHIVQQQTNHAQNNEINTYLIKQEMQKLVKTLTNEVTGQHPVIMVNNEAELMEQFKKCNKDVVDNDVEEQSPIKSLSNLVSSPIKTTSIKNISNLKKTRSSSKSQYNNTDPITANLTSCLCGNFDKTKTINNSLLKSTCNDMQCCQFFRPKCTQACSASSSLPSTSSSSSSLLSSPAAASSSSASSINYNVTHRPNVPRLSNNAIAKMKYKSLKFQQLHHEPYFVNPNFQHQQHNVPHHVHHHHHHHRHSHQHPRPEQQQQPKPQTLAEKKAYAENLLLLATQSIKSKMMIDSAAAQAPTAVAPSTSATIDEVMPAVEEASEEPRLELQTDGIDNPALAEASRNLTQTLRKLSKRVFTNKIDVINESVSRNNNNNNNNNSSGGSSNVMGAGSKIGSGAVIESMKHHGKGIYSGTFSGTLNPALQDKYGRPKRDISTIIHILNDLLSAAPQCARTGAKIVFEPTNSGVSANSASSSSASSSSSNNVNRHYSSSSRSSSRQSSRRLSAQSPAMQKVETYCQNCKTVSSVALPATPPMSLSSTSKAPWYNPKCSGHQRAGSSLSRSNVKTFWRSKDPQPNQTPHATDNNNTNVASSIACAPPANPIEFCNKCSMLNTLEMENTKTKMKVDHLRLVMQQKKERREARKLKLMPYNNTNNSTSAGTNSPKPASEQVAASTVASTAAANSATTSPPIAAATAIVKNTVPTTSTSIAAPVPLASASTSVAPTANVANTTAAATTISTSISNQSNNTAQTSDVQPTTANNHLAEEVDTIG